MYDQEELKEWDQCLLMLGDAKVDEHGNITDTNYYNSMYLDKDGEDREINVSLFLIQQMINVAFIARPVNTGRKG